MGGVPSTAKPRRPLAAGLSRRLLESYELGELLDEGAVGLVYGCRKRSMEAEVLAVKAVDKAETPWEASAREAEMLKALEHPNIVRFHEVFCDGSFVCIVMDKFEGGNLLQGLQNYHLECGNLDCRRAVHLFAQAALAVQYLHGRLVIHRDIKGDNFLIDRPDLADPRCRLALADFDIAMHLGLDERLPPERNGTQVYWAPERFPAESPAAVGSSCGGREGYGFKSDVWALGVVMYALLAGRFPFQGEEDIRSREPRYSKRLHPDCADLLRGALQKEEELRLDAEGLVAHRWLRDWKPHSDVSGEAVIVQGGMRQDEKVGQKRRHFSPAAATGCDGDVPKKGANSEGPTDEDPGAAGLHAHQPDAHVEDPGEPSGLDRQRRQPSGLSDEAAGWSEAFGAFYQGIYTVVGL